MLEQTPAKSTDRGMGAKNFLFNYWRRVMVKRESGLILLCSVFMIFLKNSGISCLIYFDYFSVLCLLMSANISLGEYTISSL